MCDQMKTMEEHAGHVLHTLGVQRVAAVLDRSRYLELVVQDNHHVLCQIGKHEEGSVRSGSEK